MSSPPPLSLKSDFHCKIFYLENSRERGECELGEQHDSAKFFVLSEENLEWQDL